MLEINTKKHLTKALLCKALKAKGSANNEIMQTLYAKIRKFASSGQIFIKDEEVSIINTSLHDYKTRNNKEETARVNMLNIIDCYYLTQEIKETLVF